MGSVEADTGAIITLLNAEMLQDLDWIQMRASEMHVQGYNGVEEPCLGKAFLSFQ